MEETFLFIIEVIGTFAFAISGIRLAAFKSFDWFGAYTVGLVTAIGGGTLRDVLLDIPVFWMQTWMYLAVTAASLAVVIMFRKLLVSKDRMLFLFDTLGLALFVVIGIQKTLAAGYPMWVAIVMGLITGSSSARIYMPRPAPQAAWPTGAPRRQGCRRCRRSSSALSPS